MKWLHPPRLGLLLMVCLLFAAGCAASPAAEPQASPVGTEAPAGLTRVTATRPVEMAPPAVTTLVEPATTPTRPGPSPSPPPGSSHQAAATASGTPVVLTAESAGVIDLQDVTPPTYAPVDEIREMPGPGDPALAVRMAGLAAADLAERLGLHVSAVTVLASHPDQYPDGSLGCLLPGVTPQPGYVNGYTVVLQAGGSQYTYHTVPAANRLVLCDTP